MTTHAIYIGMDYLGEVRETGTAWAAFDATDRRLGKLPTRVEAAQAVYYANKTEGAASAASGRAA